MIDRTSSTDLMEWASDVGPVPMQVGGIVLLDGRGSQPFDLAAGKALLADRIRTIPRLRQRLVRLPPGCGRSIWVDDATFDAARHVQVRTCPAPGDDRALLDVANEIVLERLPRNRPLWAATFITGLTGGHAALVVVFHHVLADGIGGLAILANLMDGPRVIPATFFPRPRPRLATLALDAWSAHLRALTELGKSVRSLGQARKELGAWRSEARRGKHRPRRGRPAKTSLNRPTGPNRRLSVVQEDLVRLRATAHSHDATVNDVLLTAVGGALRELLDRRGEQVAQVVINVPVSRRATTVVEQLGNVVGVMPVAVPGVGEPGERLRRVAAATQTYKSAGRGASSALVDPVIRLLSALHLAQWFMNHQRLVHTFVTNLRGPAGPVSFNGVPITDIIPIVGTYGNVTASFGALSYAGKFTITVIVDPDRVPDHATLVTALRRELAALAALQRRGLQAS